MGLVEVGRRAWFPAAAAPRRWRCARTTAARGVEGADPFPFVKRAFDLIAFAKVSTSGAEALAHVPARPADSISPNPDRLIADAKEVALGLARAGHRPRPAAHRRARAGPARRSPPSRWASTTRCAAARSASTTPWSATKIATILCGGDRAPGVATEQHFLDLEREAFLSLLGTPKTQERIQHMLKEGKPLRN